MHWSSYKNVRKFVDEYLAHDRDKPLSIADIGSMDVDLVGSYRTLFDAPNWRYIGVDLAPGANVDMVLRDPYCWRELSGNSLDVVVSGQALEHIEFFWLTFLEIHRVLKPGGLCCLVAPSAGPEHRYPVDCWRFYPDGFRAMAKYANLEVLDVFAQWDEARHPEWDPVWNDCVLIARKSCGRRRNIGVGLRRLLCRLGSPRRPN